MHLLDDAQADRDVRTQSGRDRPHHQPDDTSGTESDVKSMLTRLIDYLKTRGSPRSHQPDRQRGGRADGQRHLLPDGHLDPAADIENGVSATAGCISRQVPRHGALQPDPRVPDYRRGCRDHRRLSGPGRRTSHGLLQGGPAARDEAESFAEQQEIERSRRKKENKLRLLDAQIAALRSEFELEEKELNNLVREEELKREATDLGRTEMSRLRKADNLLKEN